MSNVGDKEKVDADQIKKASEKQSECNDGNATSCDSDSKKVLEKAAEEAKAAENFDHGKHDAGAKK